MQTGLLYHFCAHGPYWHSILQRLILPLCCKYGRQNHAHAKPTNGHDEQCSASPMRVKMRSTGASSAAAAGT